MNNRRQKPMPPLRESSANFHVTIDVVALTIIDGLLQVAVVQRDQSRSYIDIHRNGYVQEVPRHSQNHWALPGGLVHFENEDLVQAAEREIREETNIEVDPKNLIQIGAYGDLGRDPRPGRTISVAFVTFQPMFSEPKAGSDAKQARFMPVLELLTEPKRLEFDHETMLIDAIQRVRDLVLSTTIATNFCPPEFTMSELREVYEVLWHRAYDKKIDNDERQSFAAGIPSRVSSDDSQFISTLRSRSSGRHRGRNTIGTSNISWGSVYQQVELVSPDLKWELAKMSDGSLEKITKILLSDQSSKLAKTPTIRKILDPANFSRKVENIPGFIEKLPSSSSRSSRFGTGRPAQLYRRGTADRLDPPLRLEVKRSQ